MPINVYLVLSLFGRATTSAPGATALPAGVEPALWLTVQPYVLAADFASWIARARTPGALAYELLQSAMGGLSPNDIATMVPVPLPPDVLLTARRFTEFGTAAEAPAGPDLRNDRTGMVISHPAGFQADNVHPGKAGQVIAPEALPYAEAYFDQLEKFAADNGTDPVAMQQLQQMLAVNFEGGGVRRLRASTVQQQDAVELFDLEPRVMPDGLDPQGLRTVGVTSACGLMLRLDHDIGFAGLRNVDGLRRYLQQPGDPAPGTAVAMASTDDEFQFLVQYFAAIDPANPIIDPSTLWRAGIQPDAASRVYVLPHRTALAPSTFCFGAGGTDARTLFRRAPGSASRADTPASVSMSEIEDVGLFYGRTSPTETPPAAPASIQVGFYEMLQARLVPNRASTASANGPALWRLVPLPTARPRFVEFFTNLARSAPADAWPAGLTVHDTTGKRIETAGSLLESGYAGSHVLPWDDVDHVDATTLAPFATLLPTVLFWFAPPLVGTGTATSKALDVTLVRQSSTRHHGRS